MKGETIKKILKAKGIEHKDVARHLGISESYFSQSVIRSDDIRTGTLERIAEYINEPVSYFYSEQPIYTVLDFKQYQQTVERGIYYDHIQESIDETISFILSNFGDKLPESRREKMRSLTTLPYETK